MDTKCQLPSDPRDPLERNIELFPRYKAVSSVMPWLPIFFLFFIEKVSLNEAILLSSASYFSVFVLEVPSGYCSDRFGRRPTLIFAALMSVVSCVLFVVANSFLVLLIAQILMASRIAFQSGSDSALLYDSLSNLGRESEYTQLETEAQKWSMIALACSCLLGGGLGWLDLRLPYAIGLLASVVALLQSVGFVEPSVQGDRKTVGFLDQLVSTLSYFSHPLLRWVVFFFVVGYSLEHIPYEFYQPYLKLLDQHDVSGLLSHASAPLVSAVVLSISMFGGAAGAAVSQKLMGGWGLRMLLLASVLVQLIIIAGMSILLHPIMLTLVMFRNLAMSMAHGPMLGLVAPHVSAEQRATFLSMLSLFGRAAFAIVLIVLSTLLAENDALNAQLLSRVLGWAVVVGSVALGGLYLLSSRISDKF